MHFHDFTCGCFIFFSAILLRWTITLNSYSGAGKPPLFGDYEAQRHWMEITFNLSPEKWYVNSTDNDLQYWGLDYPPLTAYHSWICGKMAIFVNESWVKLDESRGTESLQHKLFMRYTVLMADILIYFSAVFTYVMTCTSYSSPVKWWCLAGMLSFPGLVLIDHGHFQYNCVSLGFTVWAVVAICHQRHLLSAMAFCLALNYKQMELYHAMPFFCFLLGTCLQRRLRGFPLLMLLGVIVIVTFSLCWLPFLHDISLVKQVLARLFPFGRGLYEDKVANVWCSLALVVKLKQIFDVTTLIRLCLLSTLVCLAPTSIHLMIKPSIMRFKFALINSALVFFLFSFQVHEKSILLAAMPACLLLPRHLFGIRWFLIITTFSMLPLLHKDGLLLPAVATCILFYLLVDLIGQQMNNDEKHISFYIRVSHVVSLLGAAGLTAASLLIPPPSHLPDLHPVLISVYSCGHFILFLFYFHWLQFTAENDPEVAESRKPVTPRNTYRKTDLKRKKLR